MNRAPSYADFLYLSGSLAMDLGKDIRIEYGARFDTVANEVKEQHAAISTNLTDCWYLDINYSKTYGIYTNESVGFTLQLRAYKESILDKKLSPGDFKY